MALVPPTVTTYHAQFMRAGVPIVMRGIDTKVNLTGDPRSSVVVKLGTKSVRLRINWPEYEPTAPQPGVPDSGFDPATFDKLDTALREFRSSSTQVLIDFHPNSIPTWVPDRTDKLGRWSNAGFRAAYMGMMKKLVLAARGYKNVWGYEVWNEPQTASDTAAATARVVAFDSWAIRSLRPLDPSRALVVMIRGGWDLGLRGANLTGLDRPHVVLDLHDQWCGCFKRARTLSGEAELHPGSPTRNKDVQPYHGTYTSQVAYLMYAINNWRRRLHRPLLVGEFETLATDPNGPAYHTMMFKLFRAYNVSAYRWVGLRQWAVTGTMETQLSRWLSAS